MIDALIDILLWFGPIDDEEIDDLYEEHGGGS